MSCCSSNSASISASLFGDTSKIPRINWSDLKLAKPTKDKKDSPVQNRSKRNSKAINVVSNADNAEENKIVLGNGSTAVVIRAFDERFGSDVAIKLYKTGGLDVEKVKEIMESELSVLQYLNDNMDTDLVIKVLGVSEGDLPKEFQDILPNVEDFEPDQPPLGIVMRLEEGGTLDRFIHSHLNVTDDLSQYVPNASSPKSRPMNLKGRLYILMKIAKCIANIHDLGVIHSDLKPANVFLSDSVLSSIRIGDFDQNFRSISDNKIDVKTAKQGTFVYTAPELLEYMQEFEGDLTKRKGTSKKTDMYSFAIICWEVLCKSDTKLPFDVELATITFQDWISQVVGVSLRPSLDDLIPSVPNIVLDMITQCWSKDVESRFSALQCYNILDQCYNTISGIKFDMYLSYALESKFMMDHLYYYLSNNLGYKVYLSERIDIIAKGIGEEKDTGNHSDDDFDIPRYVTVFKKVTRKKSTKKEKEILNSSSVLVSCILPQYAQSSICMSELTAAKEANKPIIFIPLKGSINRWVKKADIQFGDLKEIMNLDALNKSQSNANPSTSPSETPLIFDCSDLYNQSGWQLSFFDKINPFASDLKEYELPARLRASIRAKFTNFSLFILRCNIDLHPSFYGISPYSK